MHIGICITILIGDRMRRKRRMNRGNLRAASVNTSCHPVKSELISVDSGLLKNSKGLVQLKTIINKIICSGGPAASLQ
jgi:hypothetical protein